MEGDSKRNEKRQAIKNKMISRAIRTAERESARVRERERGQKLRGQERKAMHEKLHIMKRLSSEKESRQGIAMVTQGSLEKGWVGGVSCHEPEPGHRLTTPARASCSAGTQPSASLCFGNHRCFPSHHLCDREVT